METNKVVIDNLVNEFEYFKMPPVILDEYEEKGKEILKQKMLSFVLKKEPIEFVMLGYPMKSPNTRDKVIGQIPDLAEELSMKNWQHFANAMKSVYSPGINISIVSDGYIFSDIMEVNDNIVTAYNEMSKDMSKVAPITWYDAKSFYPREMGLYDIRETIMHQFGINAIELEQRILMNPDVNTLYRGMIKFLSMDLAIKNFPSGNQLHKQAKIVAREMMFRNEAYSHLIEHEFPNHIRLSMHPSVNSGAKYSFQLIDSKKAWTSPWHCAILIDEEKEFATVHKIDAEKAGYELVYQNNQPYYFQAK